MSESIFNSLSLEKIFKAHSSDTSTYDIVSHIIAGSPSIHTRYSDALADTILTAVSNAISDYENVLKSCNGKVSGKMVDEMLDNFLLSLQPDERLDYLKIMDFSFDVIRNDEYMRRIEDGGESLSSLLDEYYSQGCDNFPIKEEILINNVKNLFKTLPASPYFIKKFTEDFNKDNVLDELVHLKLNAERLVSIVVAQAFHAAQENTDINSVISQVLADPDELELIYNSSNMGELVRKKIENPVRIIIGTALILAAVALVLVFWETGAAIAIGSAAEIAAGTAATIGFSPIEAIIFVAYSIMSIIKFDKLVDKIVQKISTDFAEYVYSKDEDTEDSFLIKCLKSYIGYQDDLTYNVTDDEDEDEENYEDEAVCE